MQRHNGIHGLEPREPVGAVLSIGIKGDRGNPVERDRFHVLDPLPDASNRRHHHVRFRSFNEASPEHRRVVYGQIVHASSAEAFTHQLKNYRPRGNFPTHPNDLPFCTGDGRRASRYRGVQDDEHRFEEIVCPHDKCEFRQPLRLANGRRGPTACKPWMKMVFRLVWKQGTLPTVLCKYTSGSWNTTKSALGLFKQIDDMARMVLGEGRPYSIGGFCFSMTLGERTNKQERSRFPVVTFAPMEDPIAFFEAQINRRERIEALEREPIGLLEESVESDVADYLAHEPGVR